ncbi:response regulator [Adhaeribacter swui]|uniref:Response regulator n=1 Tax=Adhaeribacter swui TaxID=2086471 RepID=A0A7G7G6U4_9BACT|nr:response regulator [Adhaeribacter swui]QNF32878.1 response regulator [Adhaeribacter swui]
MVKTVMLVDDNMINNFIMKQIISNVDEQLEVKDFTSPQDALHNIEKVNPSLIFLDLNMPVMNGWHFLDNMAAQQMETYKVYILTSSTSELDRQRSGNYQNVLGFLNKPLDQEILAAILQSA